MSDMVEHDPVALMFAAFGRVDFQAAGHHAAEVRAAIAGMAPDALSAEIAALDRIAEVIAGFSHGTLALARLQFAEAQRDMQQVLAGAEAAATAADPLIAWMAGHFRLQAQVLTKVAAASQSLAQGDLQEAHIAIDAADSWLRKQMAQKAKAPNPDPDIAERENESLYGASLALFMAGANIYSVTCPALQKNQVGLEFIAFHRRALEALIRRSQASGPVIEALLGALAGLAEASELLLAADAAVTERDFLAAVERFQGAKEAFRAAANDFPDDIPLLAQLRTICINRAYSVPQIERYAALLHGIATESAGWQARCLAAEGRVIDMQRQGDELLGDLARKGISVTASVNNTVTVTQSVSQESLQHIEALLDGLGSADPAREAEVKKLREELEKARREPDPAKRIGQVTGVVDAMGKLAESAAKLAPYWMTGLALVKGLLM